MAEKEVPTIRIKVTEIHIFDKDGERMRFKKTLQQFVGGCWQDIEETRERITVGPEDERLF